MIMSSKKRVQSLLLFVIFEYKIVAQYLMSDMTDVPPERHDGTPHLDDDLHPPPPPAELWLSDGEPPCGC